MTHDLEPCQLVPLWLMTIPLQHCHTGSVFMVAKLKKDRLSLTQMTYDLKPCQFIPIWLMTLHLEHCHTGNVIMVAKFKKKKKKKKKKKRQTDRQNLTLMTNNWEPCQLVQIWLMPLH